MKIQQTLNFKRYVKKMHASQKKDLDLVVRVIANNPEIGDLKKGTYLKFVFTNLD